MWFLVTDLNYSKFVRAPRLLLLLEVKRLPIVAQEDDVARSYNCKHNDQGRVDHHLEDLLGSNVAGSCFQRFKNRNHLQSNLNCWILALCLLCWSKDARRYVGNLLDQIEGSIVVCHLEFLVWRLKDTSDLLRVKSYYRWFLPFPRIHHFIKIITDKFNLKIHTSKYFRSKYVEVCSFSFCKNTSKFFKKNILSTKKIYLQKTVLRYLNVKFSKKVLNRIFCT